VWNILATLKPAALADARNAELARAVVAYAMGVSASALAAETRGTPQEALARQVAMYLTHTTFELSLARTARAFGRDRSTVAHACHQIEDRREDPRFDRLLAGLEDMLAASPLPPPVGEAQAHRTPVQPW